MGTIHDLLYLEFYLKQCAMNILSWRFPLICIFYPGILHTRANWGGDSFESNSLSFYEVINSVRYTLYFHNISDQKKKKKRPKRLKLYIIIIFFWWGFFFCGRWGWFQAHSLLDNAPNYLVGCVIQKGVQGNQGA